MVAGTFHDGRGDAGGRQRLDNSAQLRELQTQVQAAAPKERWTGQAADAYAAANDQQAQRLGRMAELDQQLRAEVNRSAQVVTAGRQNLDSIRQWVIAAAASLPVGNQEQQLPIARRGVSDVADVLRQTHGELSTIGRRIQTIGQQYAALGGDRPHDDFDLDTQYVRPQGLPGGGKAPEGTVEITVGTGGITLTVVQVTQTKTWWWQPGSAGKHCK